MTLLNHVASRFGILLGLSLVTFNSPRRWSYFERLVGRALERFNDLPGAKRRYWRNCGSVPGLPGEMEALCAEVPSFSPALSRVLFQVLGSTWRASGLRGPMVLEGTTTHPL